MNLFNCFQAVAFYTLVPFLAQYLFTHDYNVGGYIAVVAELIGFVLLSVNLHENS